MAYKEIHFVSDFTDIPSAKAVMKQAQVHDAPGIGKWRLELVDGKVRFIFVPGIALAPMLNQEKSGFYWVKMAVEATTAFKEKLPGHEFAYLLV